MAQERPEGRLEVQVVAGRNIPRRSRFGRGDSLVALTLGTSTKQTQVDKKGGSAPRWNDRLSFLVSGLGKTQLHITAVEIEGSVNQKKIGSCVVDLTKVFVEEEVDGWYSLTLGDKPMGDVYIEFTYTPKGGRKQPSKAHASEDEEEDMAFMVEPKQSRANSSTVASAPAMLQKDSRPPTSGSISSTGPVPGSVAANVHMRPSMSDLRPYSSASMHSSELANKYAQKHGTKPLPAAPTMSAPPPGFEGNSGGFQSQMSMYDQTLMPGQLPYAQVQQRPMSYGGETLPAQYQGTMAPLPVSGYQQQPLQQQQQPLQMQTQESQLMTLFAPPGAPDQPPKALPDPPATTPAYNPAFNPAYNPAYNPGYANEADMQMAPQQSSMHSSLPVPVIADNGRPMSAMSVAAQPIAISQMGANELYASQQPMQFAGYAGDGQQLMQHSGVAYGSVPVQMTVTSPVQYPNQLAPAYDPYMSAQSYATDPAMSQAAFQPQYAQSLPPQQPPQQQQFVQYQQQQPMVYANVDYSQYQQQMVYAGQPVYVDQAGVPLSGMQGGYMPPQQQQMYAPGNAYGGQTY
ncbi:hypothetical protein LPJ70_000303 [Coemansia sp. RSA 2708]|nr:hypothetical protein LPJ70_000303 [Coemansia sp. RSA 2708]